ncbi:MAG: Nif3-like dinuclear metal center hexameric protein [Bacteroidota bacterium]|nr:Nif3-like dinuclear metal center hexameric protein [Bacteroidota bacterium]
MKIKEIIDELEKIAPLTLQENYDNAGLLIGNANEECKGVLITLDVTENVLEEAITKKANLIVSHHPLIFGGLKKITGKTETERITLKAIKNDVAIYAIHTNLDNVATGVNATICKKIGLTRLRTLVPGEKQLRKLVTYCPVDFADKVRMALFEAGAGHIGNYDSCSFNSAGTGTFKAGEGTHPFVGKLNELHHESEIRIETIFPFFLESKIIQALIAAHPYEEVAYDIYQVENNNPQTGAGMYGLLEPALSRDAFLLLLKERFRTGCIRYSDFGDKPIRTVAVCGGAGSFLISAAIRTGADAFITGDIKYHDFFIPEGRMLLADIGHYESEQYTKELLFNQITKIFPTFAVQISEHNTNSVHYF